MSWDGQRKSAPRRRYVRFTRWRRAHFFRVVGETGPAPAMEPGKWDLEPDPVDFDVDEAMWLLKWHDWRRARA